MQSFSQDDEGESISVENFREESCREREQLVVFKKVIFNMYLTDLLFKLFCNVSYFSSAKKRSQFDKN